MARACIPFHVKNTFITVGEEDSLDDVGVLKLPGKRQMTEPAYLHNGPIEPEQEPSMDSLPSWSADAAQEGVPTGNAEDDSTEDEVEELDSNDWKRIVTGVEPGILPPMVAGEESLATIDEQAWHALTVPENPGWMYGYSNFPTWQMPVGSQGVSAPIVHSNTVSASQPPPEWARTTTVMMRNLPNKYTQGMMLGEINAAGFSKAYDFFYLPVDPETRANRGYAFINFRDARLSWKFKVHFESRQMNHFNSQKSITVVAAALQGFDANYQHYSKCRASKSAPEMRPLFFKDFEHVGVSRHKRGGKPSLIDLAAKQKLTVKKEKDAVQFCYSCGDTAGPEFKFCRSCGTFLQAGH